MGPLLLTADSGLVEDILALAAAADVTVNIVTEPIAALASWTRAAMVLIGADLADEVARLGAVRRANVFVVTRERAPDLLFRTALRVGADDVVEVGLDSAELVELLADRTERRAAVGRVIGVLAGSGGAGATTFACALAQAAARTGETALIDSDPLGPGLDRLLGLERTPGSRWDALGLTTGRLSARALRDALPRAGLLGVLSWHAGAKVGHLNEDTVREALSAARRGNETVVVDLPRAPGEVADEIAARCDELLVLARGTLPGVSSAARLRARLDRHPAAAVVLRGDGVAVRDVETALQLPVRVRMRDQPRLAEALDLGLGPLRSRRGPLARAVSAVLAAPPSRTI